MTTTPAPTPEGLLNIVGGHPHTALRSWEYLDQIRSASDPGSCYPSTSRISSSANMVSASSSDNPCERLIPPRWSSLGTYHLHHLPFLAPLHSQVPLSSLGDVAAQSITVEIVHAVAVFRFVSADPLKRRSATYSDAWIPLPNGATATPSAVTAVASAISTTIEVPPVMAAATNNSAAASAAVCPEAAAGIAAAAAAIVGTASNPHAAYSAIYDGT